MSAAMDATSMAALEANIRNELAELDALVEGTEADRKPIELDQQSRRSISREPRAGRLSSKDQHQVASFSAFIVRVTMMPSSDQSIWIEPPSWSVTLRRRSLLP